MKIEVKNYTYETMPEYTDHVEGAKYIQMDPSKVGVEYINDVVYDTRETGDLHLQILMPKVFNDPDRIYPCVIYVQGSAWMKQNCYRDLPQLSLLARHGYVVAVVEYRHSGIAKFPCPIVDAKNAVRFMRVNHEMYHVDPEKLIMMGNSSGGHTSSMAGMTCRTNLFDDPKYEVSCEVKGIINLYGSTEVTLEYGFPTTLNHQQADSPEGMELGYNILENLEKAKEANSKTYASLDFPPMLIVHGTKDKTVFAQESVNLYEACLKEGKDVTMYFVKGADHGGVAFWQDDILGVYLTFIEKCLKD